MPISKAIRQRLDEETLPGLLKLAALRLSTDFQNGNLSSMLLQLSAVPAYESILVLEMSNTMTGQDREVLMRALLRTLNTEMSPRAGQWRALRDLAALQLDAKAP